MGYLGNSSSTATNMEYSVERRDRRSVTKRRFIRNCNIASTFRNTPDQFHSATAFQAVALSSNAPAKHFCITSPFPQESTIKTDDSNHTSWITHITKFYFVYVCPVYGYSLHWGTNIVLCTSCIRTYALSTSLKKSLQGTNLEKKYRIVCYTCTS